MRGDARPGEPSVSAVEESGFVLRYSDPEHHQRQFKSAPCFSSESLAAAFLAYNNTDHRIFFPLKKRKGTGEIFDLKRRVILIFPAN